MTDDNAQSPITNEIIEKLNSGQFDDPFSVFGRHKYGRASWVVALDQGADRLEAVIGAKVYELARVVGSVFAGKVPAKGAYRLRGHGADGAVWEYDDAYRFGPVLSDLDEYLLGEGTHQELWRVLGAHPIEHEGVQGTHFAVWAPNAFRVSVVGNFNGWDGRRHVMRRRGGTGVWEIFVPGLGVGERYKYELLDSNRNLLPQKADPVGFGAEHPPETASVVRSLDGGDWKDAEWGADRQAYSSVEAPISKSQSMMTAGNT